MEVKEFVRKLRDTEKLKTMYVYGGYGMPLNQKNKERAMRDYDYNRRRDDIIGKADGETYGFDCSGLIKGILWGFTGDSRGRDGGSVYASNGVPDYNANSMIKASQPSEDFKGICEGAMLWMPGHVGVYVGEGLAIESAPSGKNGVQYTVVRNVSSRTDIKKGRTWKSWGKLPWVEYGEGKKAEDVLRDIYGMLSGAKKEGLF